MNSILVVNRTKVNAEALAVALAKERPQLDLVPVSSAEARSRARVCPPDIALIELDIAVGLKLMRDLVRDHPALRLFIYGSADDERELGAWAGAGASRIFISTISLRDLARSVYEAGRLDAQADQARVIVHRTFDVISVHRRTCGVGANLTRREQDVLRLIAIGLSNREVAQMLSLELPTVKNHVQHLMRKIGVHRRADAARYWSENQTLTHGGDRPALKTGRQLEGDPELGLAGPVG